MKTSLLVLLLMTGLSACAQNASGRANAPQTTYHGSAFGGYVLTGEDWRNRGSGNALTIIQTLPGARIRPIRGCMEVFFRGRDRMGSSTGAQIFVDGVPSQDACILASLHMEDIERIEVNPTSLLATPSYASKSSGTIMIYTRRGKR